MVTRDHEVTLGVKFGLPLLQVMSKLQLISTKNLGGDSFTISAQVLLCRLCVKTVQSVKFLNHPNDAKSFGCVFHNIFFIQTNLGTAFRAQIDRNFKT
jgi:hypothetical protein